ncbi:histamine N-methyltransferase-like [Glandiceps talaboti]
MVFPKVVYVAVEPVEEELQKFIELTVSKKTQKQWENVKFEFNIEKIEDYVVRVDKGEVIVTFHFIHAIHSVYHFPEPVDMIVRLYEMLAGDGILVNVTVSGQVGKLLRNLGKYYHDPKGWFINSDYIEEKVGQRLPDVNLKTITQPVRVKVTKCFNEESPEGDDTLDFMTQIPGFRKNAPKAIQDEVMTFLKKETITEPNGDVIIRWDSGYMILRKE